jgi:mono/diheme cytochrome c family protein
LTQESSTEDAAATETPAADDGKGIGPVTTVEVGAAIEEALATTGQTLFEGKCSACHQLSDQKVVGPGLAGVTERRKPEWVMNMIINPEEMTKKDPEAKKLLAEHLTQMTNQNVNEQDARAILEFLRKNDKAS